jgi:hypothetical protein
MPLPPTQFQYQSPPGSGSNDGALPQVWDPAWQKWASSLTQQQIAAFQAFPQDLIAYIAYSRWIWEVRGSSTPGPPTPYITVPIQTGIQLLMDRERRGLIAEAKQAIDNGALVIAGSTFPLLAFNGTYLISANDLTALYGYVVRYVASTFVIAGVLTAQVQGGQITTRAPIDAAFAGIQVG